LLGARDLAIVGSSSDWRNLMAGFGNLAEVVDQLDRYSEGFVDGAFKGAIEAATAILERSQTYCPIDTGALRSTARLTAELSEIDRSSVDMTYGGADSIAPYAAIVHENLEARHNPPTQAKYLQRAVDELAPEITLRVGDGAVSGGKARAGV
jgi:hypothetical protein